MGGRAVECTALEMRHTRKGIGGSNPSPSAIQSTVLELVPSGRPEWRRSVGFWRLGRSLRRRYWVIMRRISAPVSGREFRSTVSNFGVVMHPSYQDMLVSRASRLVGAAQSVRNIKHNGLRGTLRELVARELLLPLLPPQFLVGSGEIISSYGQTSGQSDIIVADRRILPPMLIDNAMGVFPIESTLVTIEVKSTINSTELQKAENAAAVTSKFMHAPPVSGGGYIAPIEHVVPYILAFESDLAINGTTEIDRYEKILGGANPSIKGLCVVGRGFWFHTGKGWSQWRSNLPYGEVVEFIVALVNTVERIALTRKQPDMRAYVF